MRELDRGVLKDTEEDLAALVDSEEALSGNINNLGSQSLSVLDQGLLDDLQEFVGAAAHIRKVVEDLSELIEAEVSMKALID